MKHAIIMTGGKQYRVAEGDVIFVEKLDVEAGETVKFDKDDENSYASQMVAKTPFSALLLSTALPFPQMS